MIGVGRLVRQAVAVAAFIVSQREAHRIAVPINTTTNTAGRPINTGQQTAVSDWPATGRQLIIFGKMAGGG